MAGLLMKYFVLKPASNDLFGSASRMAMLTYAEVIKEKNPEFAEDLITWVQHEQAEVDKSYEAAMARVIEAKNKDENGG
jgi:hypothetical protein